MTNNLFLASLLPFLFAATAATAQSAILDNVRIPITHNGTVLPSGLAGGLGAPQFSEADLNNDGISDLVIFDRSGGVWTTYLKTTATGGYRYAPEYAANFPKTSNWALLRDSNCDGIVDLYTSLNSGVRLYRGFYQNGRLHFTLRNATLLYPDPYSGGYLTNVYVSNIDIPTIEDIDNDGDIDILTFEGGGSYMQLYKCMSQEVGRGCGDSLRFKLVDECWGRFSEDQLNSTINLSPRRDSCPGRGQFIGARHAGSTSLALDMDNDGDKELLLGDISNYRLTYLVNRGTADTAFISTATPNYPISTPIISLDFPAGFAFDTDGDSKRDLVLSTNNPLKYHENYKVWRMKNIGADKAPVWQYVENDFIGKDMIDVGMHAIPVLFDYNNDGKMDIVIGGTGRYDVANTGSNKFPSSLHLYKNIGTQTAPAFELQTTDWLNLKAQNYKCLAPNFGDLNGDGVRDLLLGNEDGNLIFIPCTGLNNGQYTFGTPQNNWQTIDVGLFSIPEIVDFDRDGYKDVLIGKNRSDVSYYWNDRNGNFRLRCDSVGKMDGRNFAAGSPVGFVVPRCVDVNGVYQIWLGTDAGNIQQYTANSITNPSCSDVFTKNTNSYGNIFIGNNAAPAVGDLNADGVLDFVVGNKRGGISIFSAANWLATTDQQQDLLPEKITVFPNPTNSIFTVSIDGEPTKHRITVFNTLGELLFTHTTLTNQLQLSLAPQAAGIYFIQVENELGQRRTQRIIKN